MGMDRRTSRRVASAGAGAAALLSLIAVIVVATTLETSFMLQGTVTALLVMSVLSLVAVPVAAAVALHTEHLVAARVYLGVLVAFGAVFAVFGMTFATLTDSEVETTAREEFPGLSESERAKWDNDPLVLRDAFLADAGSNAAVSLCTAVVMGAAAVATWMYHQHLVEASTAAVVENENLEQFRKALTQRRASALMPDPKQIRHGLKEAKLKARRQSTMLQQQQNASAAHTVQTELAMRHRGSIHGSLAQGGSTSSLPGMLAASPSSSGMAAAAAPGALDGAAASRLAAAMAESGADLIALVEICKARPRCRPRLAALWSGARCGAKTRRRRRRRRRRPRRRPSTQRPSRTARRAGITTATGGRARTAAPARTGGRATTSRRRLPWPRPRQTPRRRVARRGSTRSRRATRSSPPRRRPTARR